MTYLLRIEGVNLSNFVYDTQDLSTVRGGGLLMLEAVVRVERELQKHAREFKPISTGASSGLFEFDADDGEKVRAKIEANLNDDEQLKHATFVVDVINADDDDTTFPKNKEDLIARNRWRQMQSPSLAVPSPESGCELRCNTDLIRPQSNNKNRQGKDGKVSESVYQRRTFGIDQKWGEFYTSLPVHLSKLREDYPDKAAEFKEAEANAAWLSQGDIKFTNDLNELSQCKEFGNLNNKIAVIYADGNSFGKLQQGFGKKEQEEFDLLLKAYRSSFLLKLLGEMKGDPDWKNKDRYRIETLLWGGDEFMMVVPAWKGWETLQMFYEISAEWKFGDKDLTHSAGLVFCHHNAPIHRIKQLAHDLAELCKSVEKEDFHKDQEGYEESTTATEKGDYFAFQVLESSDNIPGSLKKYRQSICPKKTHYGALMLNGSDMQTISDSMLKIKGDEKVSRGRLHAVVKSLIAGKDEEAKVNIKKLTAACANETNDEIETLKESLNGENVRWLQISELWDYIVKGGAKK